MTKMTELKTTNRKVAVLGATGNMGKLFVEQALDAGYDIRVLVRDPAKLARQNHPQIKVMVGDAAKPEDVSELVTGVDVVVSCLGNVGGHLIMQQSFENILAAAGAQQYIPRCLLITSVGCGGTSWLVKRMLILIGGKDGFQDYDRADQRVLNERTVPCVLVRPYSLNDKPGTGKYNASEKHNATFMRPISRADVATFLVDAVADQRWDGKPGIQLGGRK